MKISKSYEEWVLDWQSCEEAWSAYFEELRAKTQIWF